MKRRILHFLFYFKEECWDWDWEGGGEGVTLLNKLNKYIFIFFFLKKESSRHPHTTIIIIRWDFGNLE